MSAPESIQVRGNSVFFPLECNKRGCCSGATAGLPSSVYSESTAGQASSGTRWGIISVRWSISKGRGRVLYGKPQLRMIVIPSEDRVHPRRMW